MSCRYGNNLFGHNPECPCRKSEVEAGRDAWVDYGHDPEPEDFWDRLDRGWAEMKESW